MSNWNTRGPIGRRKHKVRRGAGKRHPYKPIKLIGFVTTPARRTGDSWEARVFVPERGGVAEYWAEMRADAVTKEQLPHTLVSGAKFSILPNPKPGRVRFHETQTISSARQKKLARRARTWAQRTRRLVVEALESALAERVR